ncbi:PREDICTED: uncharacterized protein LOC101294697 [Fragaria vesca subsp. vesca]|uniref:uncharacterized protein LOC101294697 n=1 Tax=Fragaria vesca subsp. vesca TaxID=101020 RepID=UPI0002C35F5F|nr:PREDICTED: uncharacterized protein LOC101294697 [Fragaria vesca subsp. vesca]XP_011465529.1 PREDICTED: uncharacterized protein LOC101294697 [Fragaria vesca subsp. vesca]
MGQHFYGTTDIAVLCKDGIILANDARITLQIKDELGKEDSELATDEGVKMFQLCSKPKIYCTLMGDVKQWHEMYEDLLRRGPKSVEDAKNYAEDYLKGFRRKDRKNRRTECGAFGIIVAGYQEQKGFQIFGVTYSGKKVEIHNGPMIAIGSGCFYAIKCLNIRKGNPNMSEEFGTTITLQALMESSFQDRDTGGYLKVIFVHKDGCISNTYQVLDVYNALYNPSDQDEKSTMFMMYSTSIGPIFSDDEILALIRDLWSTSVVNTEEYKMCNIIAKKANYYITRIVLDKEKDAERVYEYLSTKNARPFFPKTLSHIRSELVDCIREKTRDHIYVGRSSKRLLEGICKLQNADSFKYQ